MIEAAFLTMSRREEGVARGSRGLHYGRSSGHLRWSGPRGAEIPARMLRACPREACISPPVYGAEHRPIMDYLVTDLRPGHYRLGPLRALTDGYALLPNQPARALCFGGASR
jgi:hypothetical protein